MNEPIRVALSCLISAEGSLRRDIAARPPSDAVATALDLMLDAASELRGEIAARQPEHPLLDVERVVLTGRELL